MSSAGPPNSGAVGGASVDAGVQYQRSVGAYAVSHGLAGVGLLGFGVPAADAVPTAVSLETDHAVDDVAVECETARGVGRPREPWTILIQARRRLRRDSSFETAAAQWVDAARGGLDPDRQHLVLVTGSASGPIHQVRTLLDRLRTDRPGRLTKIEEEAKAYLDAQLTGLSASQRRALLSCAHIHVLEVEDVHSSGAREAVRLLERVVGPDGAIDAWHDLVRLSGEAARLRGGWSIAGWLRHLTELGYEVRGDEATAAAKLERQRRALSTYRGQVRLRGAQIDLRPLGASVSPIPVDDLGMRPHATVPGESDRDEHVLTWALLRRGRAVLTGLPGGGKSTALRIAAADLIPLAEAPLPVVVSLKDIDAGDRAHSFRDRLLDTAVRDLAGGDRKIVRAEIEDRMAAGTVLLFLDALDETRDRRGEVVHELDEFLRGVSEDVGIVLATRDVAYGQASTFGWADLRIAAPKETSPAVRAILERSARDVEDDAWVANRLRWVERAIGRDITLRETPLLPVLLALLAAEKDEDSLPDHRATILHAVVESVVNREAKRRSSFTLGSLIGEAARRAALDGYAAEATQLARDGGRTALEDLRVAVGEMLQRDWRLEGRPADVTAEAIIHFWDEAGFFVISGANETVGPRLELFAEVGEARHAVAQPHDDVFTWVETAARAGRLESLVLAAGLSPVAAEALVATAVEQHDRELLLTATTARKQGAEFPPASMTLLVEALAGDAAAGARQGWDSFAELLALPLDDGQVALAADVLGAFPEEHQIVGRALLALRYASPPEEDRQTDVLMDVLRLGALPRLESRVPGTRPGLHDIAVDRLYADAKVGAAERLLGVVDEADALVLSSMEYASGAMVKRIGELVVERDRTDLAETLRARERERMGSIPSLLGDFDIDGHLRLLDALCEAPPVELSARQAVRLDELADLCETLNLNDTGAWPRTKPGRFDEFMAVVHLVQVLGGFDPGVISAQARLVRDRLEHSDDHAAFFALLDRATRRNLDRWHDVEDPASAAALLVGRLSRGLGAAHVARLALWGAPVSDVAAPLIRDLLPRLTSSPRHQEIAAYTLLSLTEAAELDAWITDPDATLRTVAAGWIKLTNDDGVLTPAARQLLTDADKSVAARILRRLDAPLMPAVRSDLERLVESPPRRWRCWSCGTANDHGGRSCTQCSIVGPEPVELAKGLLVR